MAVVGSPPLGACPRCGSHGGVSIGTAGGRLHCQCGNVFSIKRGSR